MNARTSKRQKRLSKQQESSVAEAIGGKTQAASGATRLGGGGDVRATGIRVECKYTEQPSYSLKKEILDKVKMQAIKGGLEFPIVQLDFRDPKSNRSSRFAIFPSDGGELDILVPGKSILLNNEELKIKLTNKHKLVIGFGTTPENAELFDIMKWETYLEVNNINA